MVNIVLLVGRVVETPIIKVSEQGTTYSVVTLAVTRAFKNVDGNNDCDFIRCFMWEALANSTVEYCQKGDIIGVRGRLMQKVRDITFTHDGDQSVKKISTIDVIAEWVSFIALNKKIHEDKDVTEINE